MKIIKNYKSFLNENKTESIESTIKDPKAMDLGQKVAQDPKALKAIMDELNKNGIDMELIKKAGQNIIDGNPLNDEMKAEIEKVEGLAKNESRINESRITDILKGVATGGVIGAGVAAFGAIGALPLSIVGIATAIGAAIGGGAIGTTFYSMMKSEDKKNAVIYKELEKFINLSLNKFNNDKQKTLNFVTGCIESGDFDFWLTHAKNYFVFNGIRVSSNEHGYEGHQHGEAILNNLCSKAIEILGMPSDTTFYPESAFKNKLGMVARSYMNSREDVERVLFAPEKSVDDRARKKEEIEKIRLARQEYLNSQKK